MRGRRRAVTSLALAAGISGSIVWGAACRRGGGSSSSSTRDTASIVWSIELGAAAFPSALAVAPDGTVYVAAFDRPESPPPGYASAEGFRQVCLYAIDAQGQVSRRLAGTVTRDTPEVWVQVSPWGTVYALDALGGIYGLLPAGRERFNAAPIRVVGPAALGNRGQLLVGGQGGVTVLELEADSPASLLASTGSSHASPPALAADGTVFFTSSSGGQLRAVGSQGELLWETRAAFARPVLGRGATLYLASGTRLSAFASNGLPLWEFETETPLGTPPEVGPDEAVYVATVSGLLYSVKGGQKLWSFPLERGIRSNLSVDLSGAVYAADTQGKVYGVGPDGRRRWAVQLRAATGTPVPGPDGTVYVTDADGRLYALRPPLAGD